MSGVAFDLEDAVQRVESPTYCSHCGGGEPKQLRACAVCLSEHYCSEACQSKSWNALASHRDDCQASQEFQRAYRGMIDGAVDNSRLALLYRRTWVLRRDSDGDKILYGPPTAEEPPLRIAQPGNRQLPPRRRYARTRILPYRPFYPPFVPLLPPLFWWQRYPYPGPLFWYGSWQQPAEL